MATNENLTVTASINGYDVFTSGVVHVESETSIRVNINDFTLEFQFASDATGIARYDGYVENNKLRMVLYNHKNNLGEGLMTPTKATTINGKNYYFTYYLTTVDLEKNSRRLEYVIYTEA